MAVSVTPCVVQITRHFESVRARAAHRSFLGPCPTRDVGECVGWSKNQLALSITSRPPGAILGITASAQYSRADPSTSANPNELSANDEQSVTYSLLLALSSSAGSAA